MVDYLAILVAIAFSDKIGILRYSRLSGGKIYAIEDLYMHSFS